MVKGSINFSVICIFLQMGVREMSQASERLLDPTPLSWNFQGLSKG